jgi:NAD(P)-dependent dehydrogenase (short-subunit alcohol dehydrogenase family)
VLVANAGTSRSATIEDTAVEDLDKLFAVNVRALLPGPAAAVHHVQGQQHRPGLVAGCALGRRHARRSVATKGAMGTLVKHFAAALGERGIRVNSVAPGVVPTDMSSFAKSEAGRNSTPGMQALKRVAETDDIASAIAFLASDQARWITGDTLHVDGGSKL